MELDFGPMIAIATSTAVVAAIVGMGVVKLGPNFAKWAVNKVAGFFR
jgi:hypothetical protein